MSNNHVFARRDDARLGDAIRQPASQDGGTDEDTIARLSAVYPLREGKKAANRLDAATSTLMPGIHYRLEFPKIGGLRGTSDPVVGMRVCQIGGSSGYTEGVIRAIDLDELVYLDPAEPGRAWRFIGVFRIEVAEEFAAFARAGDSGALVIEIATRKAVGLLFSGGADESYALASPIDVILDELGLELLT